MVSMHPPPPSMTPLTYYEPKCNREAANMVSMNPPPAMAPLTSYSPKCNREAVNIVSMHPLTHGSTHSL
ncbi:hypothetical protein PISMIDRAFT_273968 [Pisolithus microcarpus 441]|uniref:Uncharacterized protein n=1 Tax=Pisolithus microcarpus 441 TaxID=765257 RepID=A0A0C9ZK80_9AGAM|nr:hypothetical protein PISMIDRAFT_273968 [Pisolithus microcarpus 441]